MRWEAALLFIISGLLMLQVGCASEIPGPQMEPTNSAVIAAPTQAAPVATEQTAHLTADVTPCGRTFQMKPV